MEPKNSENSEVPEQLVDNLIAKVQALLDAYAKAHDDAMDHLVLAAYNYRVLKEQLPGSTHEKLAARLHISEGQARALYRIGAARDPRAAAARHRDQTRERVARHRAAAAAEGKAALRNAAPATEPDESAVIAYCARHRDKPEFTRRLLAAAWDAADAETRRRFIAEIGAVLPKQAQEAA